MPNKFVDNLKDKITRYCAQEWQKSLNLKNMTTREWDDAAQMAANAYSEEKIRKDILKNRKGT
jgi:hypothetical protein